VPDIRTRGTLPTLRKFCVVRTPRAITIGDDRGELKPAPKVSRASVPSVRASRPAKAVTAAAPAASCFDFQESPLSIFSVKVPDSVGNRSRAAIRSVSALRRCLAAGHRVSEPESRQRRRRPRIERISSCLPRRRGQPVAGRRELHVRVRDVEPT
jgi:hypothetical protein